MTVETMVLGPVSANTYIVTDDVSVETAIVDCGECTPELLDRLNGKNVKYILLTHGHADHILGVYDLKQAFPEAKIVIHKKDADCLTNEMMSIAFSIAPHTQKNIEPDITVGEGDVISLGSLDFNVMHTPGHSEGSVCYLIDDLIFSGDTLFFGSVGRTDFEYGNYDDIIKSVKRLAALEGNRKVFPGHGMLTTLERERKNNVYINEGK